MSGLSRPGRGLAAALVVLGGTTITVADPSPPSAGASHYRANQLSWHRAGTTGNVVEFHLTGSWRANICWYVDPATGTSTCAPTVGYYFQDPFLDFGDNQGESPKMFVVSVDIANNVVNATAHVTHTYATTGPVTAFVSTCCRLDSSDGSGNFHINNPSRSVRFETIVDLNRTSASPLSQISPIIDCGLIGACQFFIPATDSDNQDLRWRMASASEAGGGFVQPGQPRAPNAATIDPATGFYSWDTTGAQVSQTGNSFYSTQVVIENVVSGDVVTKTAVDFFIRLTNSPNNPPAFTAPTPDDGTALTISLGSSLSIDIAASDRDADDAVTLGVLGLPSGATFTSNSPPTNPATGNLSWTPQTKGSTILTFVAQDTQGRGALPRSVTVRVGVAPAFISPPTPIGDDGPPMLTTFVGHARTFLVNAADGDAGDIVSLGTLGVPSGMSCSYATGPANPVDGSCTWIPAAEGTASVTLTAHDQAGVGSLPRVVGLSAVRAVSVLRANPAVARPPSVSGTRVNSGVYFPYLSALVTNGASSPSPGAPLAGKQVTFSVGTEVICSATSGTDGQAYCQGSLPTAQLAVILDGRYTATFAGDAAHTPSTATAELVETS